MSHNPYSPPKAPVEAGEQRPDGALAARFYSPTQLAVGTFLGGLIPASVMAAANIRAMGHVRHSAFAVLGGIVATVGMFAFGTRFPQIPVLISTALQTLIVFTISRQAFGPAFERHRAAGGAVASWWRTIGIALLCALVIAAIVLLSMGFLVRKGWMPA